ncbi:MAG: type II toxin-antitoxin system HicB family antitoxin [Myxococcota bacterium]
MIGLYVHYSSGLTVDVKFCDEGNFVATVPDLPGCVTFAPTFDELVAEIDMAIIGVLDVLQQTDEPRHDLLIRLSTARPEWLAVAEARAQIPAAS